MKLSVIVPCYCEAKNAPAHLKELHKLLSTRFNFGEFEIIAVDDGSPDNTFAVLKNTKRHAKSLKIIHYMKNRGKGYAVKVGMLHAKGEVAAYIDADGEISAQHILDYYDIMEAQNMDVVIGSKTHLLSQTEFSSFRQLTSKVFQQLAKRLFHLEAEDTQVGVKMFREDAKNTVFPLLKTYGFAFDLEVLAWVGLLGFKLTEAPVEIKHSVKNSSLGVRVMLKALWEMWIIRGRIREDIVVAAPNIKQGNFTIMFPRKFITYA